MRLIDGIDFFIQVCRTHDEFIGLDELAELLDKMSTVEAIPVEWIEKWIETDRNTKRRTPYYYKRLFRSRLKMMLEDWRKANDS